MSLESKANTPGSSLEGYLLIAAPRMDDPRFNRSVVLVLHHDDGGAMGVILNRPIDDSVNVSDQLESVFDSLRSDNNGDLPVRIGGPVAGPLIALRPPSVRGGKGGVYLIEGQKQLEQLKMQEANSLQFFVGHAGWKSGQLEEELDSGWWMTLPAGPEFLEMEYKEMWLTALRESGRSVYREVLGIRGFPVDATLN